MKEETWEQFVKWGSGWQLEAERACDKKGEPLFYHLRMFGLHYPKDYELTGYRLEELLKQAIRDGKRSMAQLKQKLLKELAIEIK